MLRNTYQHGEKMKMLNRLKAKITKLHSDRLRRVMLDQRSSTFSRCENDGKKE